jgi:DNA mismatch repair protein MutS2
LDELLAAVEERARVLAEEQAALEERRLESESLAARLALQAETQEARDTELRRREKDAERRAREQARAFLLEARQRVEEALGVARGAADDAKAREARRVIEEAVQAEGQRLAADRADDDEMRDEVAGRIEVGSRVRIGTGSTGEVAEIRADGKLVVLVGAMRIVVDAGSVVALSGRAAKREAAQAAHRDSPPAPDAALEIDLRGMTGDEAEAATLAALDAAVLAEHPYLRIIHGMGTGVLRERVQGILKSDRRVAKFGFAPRNQGGTGVTIVEFKA